MPIGRFKLAVLVAAAATSLVGLSTVRADGEAGLVIQEGDVVTTYCVAFSGDSISGDQLLKQAGHTFDVYAAGSALAVCSIDGKGCNDAGSFSSCFCQCQGGDCTYWAFFTRAYRGGWVYSALAFNLLKAKDGEVHGWKWGKGGPNSAPTPADVTFEQVCGHSPRGGAAQPTATLAATPPTAAPANPSTTLATQPPSVSETTPPPSNTSGPTALITIAGATAASSPAQAAPTAAADANRTAGSGDSSEAGGAGSLVAFAAIAGLLVVSLAAAALWRARHDP